ncbi:peptidase S8 and S53 subtilisin kexin sedolisin [Saccharothrix syringae]|uniref:Peptidase S8 and S53 subtilisin kexin sedolisin n=2 Tax=Saccharothrix syringae TaxID=103733 RepID=A0A5Q0HEU6_SACSY|nr:peptidase S8 and S53 subtilisin kexin sedolisin [Saccharothrix syringae]
MRRHGCALGVALLTAALIQGSAPPGAAAGPNASGPPAEAHRITLITGDVASYQQDPGTVRIDPAPREDGSQPSFATTTTAHGVFAYPSDALPLIGAGRLDPELFNITALVADGRQDDETPTIPVIAKPDGRPMALAVHTHLSDAVGVRVPKQDAPRFWASLKADELGLSSVRLDRKVRPLLERSTRQIGAPTAWDLGLDGSGVKVAVVDTGVDDTHPDLAGKVVAAADFSGEGDAVDRHGHGTHVASTIAGTGRASDGRNRGVAPGASLLSAKVFDGSGQGDESGVMAGIEWAVAQGADVVNLSMGSGVTDGSDPLSELVDSLSASTGTLFVVAAGNDGPGDRSINSPGSAASALTVGAVDRDDSLAWFTSRGPRLRDALVKPEIVAPGVGIVAARAAGTAMGEPVDDYYTAASGTSMATPHVAGAAALLAQQHPDWTGATIKDVLASTAKDVGHKWYEQGAGRLDVARAVTQRTTGPASASFGKVEGVAPAKHAVTYTNTGDAPLTAGLALGVASWDGSAPDPGTMALAGSSLALPARSTADITVTVDPDEGPFGVYGGTVVATTPDGGTVRTPVSTYNAPPLFPVSVRVLDTSGTPAKQAVVQLVDDRLGTENRNDPFLDQVEHWVDLVDGAGRVSLPASTYSALGWTSEKSLTARRWLGLSAAEVPVSGATTITLDGRATVPVSARPAGRTDQRDRTVALRRVLPATGDREGLVTEVGLSAGATPWEVRLTPAAAAGTGAVSVQDHGIHGSAAVDLKSGATTLDPVYDVPSITTWPGEHRLALVPQGAADQRGRAVLVRLPAPTGTTDPVSAANRAALAAAQTAAQAGAAAVIAYVDVPGALPLGPLTGAALPLLSLGNAQGEALRAAGGEVSITVRPVPAAMFNIDAVDRDGVPKEHVRTYRPEDLVAQQATYHADQPGLTGQKTWYAFPEGLWKTQFAQAVRVPLPGTWTEYTGPGDEQVVWKRVVSAAAPGGASLAMNQFNVYRPGERTRPDEHWFRAPLRATATELNADHPGRYPSAADRWKVLCSACREGDLFTPPLQWVDGAHFVSPHENGKYSAITTARLFRDDREIKPVDDPLAQFPRFPLAAESATYRLEVTDAMVGPGKSAAPSTLLFAHAQRTQTTWTFTSARSTAAPPAGYSCQGGSSCSFQPLILLDHRLPLTADNVLVGRSFEVAAASHTGARGGGAVVWLHVYASTDGTTWTELAAQPSGTGVWTVTAPSVSGDVWLRTEARDVRGNTVRQTVERAYRSP